MKYKVQSTQIYVIAESFANIFPIAMMMLSAAVALQVWETARPKVTLRLKRNAAGSRKHKAPNMHNYVKKCMITKSTSNRGRGILQSSAEM